MNKDQEQLIREAVDAAKKYQELVAKLKDEHNLDAVLDKKYGIRFI